MVANCPPKHGGDQARCLNGDRSQQTLQRGSQEASVGNPTRNWSNGVEIGAAPLSTDCDGGMSQGLITVKRVVTDLV